MEPYRLEGWLVEPDRNLLRRGAARVRLEPRTMDLLCALAERPGAVRSKGELLDRVWGEVAVADAVLTTAVYQLRRALSDDRRRPRFIETVPRRGYRLVAEVRPASRRRVSVEGLVAALLVGAAALGGILVVDRGLAERRAAREIHRLAAANLDRGVALEEAVRLLRRARELDAADPAIAASLALALTLRGGVEDGEIRAAFARASRTGGVSVEARMARGLSALWEDWDWRHAERELALAARTGDPRAKAWLAYLYALSGRPEEAAPLLTGIDAPPLAVVTASTTRLLLGDVSGAERAVLRAAASDPANAALLGQLDKIRERRRELADPDAPPPVVSPTRPAELAHLHLRRGEIERALEALERAWRDRDEALLYLRVDRRWDTLRETARFQAIARAVGP